MIPRRQRLIAQKDEMVHELEQLQSQYRSKQADQTRSFSADNIVQLDTLQTQISNLENQINKLDEEIEKTPLLSDDERQQIINYLPEVQRLIAQKDEMVHELEQLQSQYRSKQADQTRSFSADNIVQLDALQKQISNLENQISRLDQEINIKINDNIDLLSTSKTQQTESAKPVVEQPIEEKNIEPLVSQTPTIERKEDTLKKYQEQLSEMDENNVNYDPTKRAIEELEGEINGDLGQAQAEEPAIVTTDDPTIPIEILPTVDSVDSVIDDVFNQGFDEAKEKLKDRKEEEKPSPTAQGVDDEHKANPILLNKLDEFKNWARNNPKKFIAGLVVTGLVAVGLFYTAVTGDSGTTPDPNMITDATGHALGLDFSSFGPGSEISTTAQGALDGNTVIGNEWLSPDGGQAYNPTTGDFVNVSSYTPDQLSNLQSQGYTATSLTNGGVDVGWVPTDEVIGKSR